MVYFSDGQITIRNMECKDAQAITDAEMRCTNTSNSDSFCFCNAIRHSISSCDFYGKFNWQISI